MSPESQTATSLGRIFQRTVARCPDSIGIVDRRAGDRLTYAEWDDRVSTAAAALEEYGIGQQDHVGIFMNNRIEYATLFWATQQIGAVFVPLNARYAADELAQVIETVGLDFLFVSDHGREEATEALSAISLDEAVFIGDDAPDSTIAYEAFLDHDRDDFEPTYGDATQTCYILHTSGTTGQPKPVPHSNRSGYTTPKVIAFEALWEHGDSILSLLPLYHMAGLQTLTVSVLCGGKWIAQSDSSPTSLVETIAAEEPTYFYSVPTVYHSLVESNEVTTEDVEPVDKLIYAGSLMSEPLQRRVMDLFDYEEFINFYGCTEMHNLAVYTNLEEKPTCTGQACIDTRLRVIDPTEGDPDVRAPQGELGGVIADASSSACFDGYIDRPEANEEAFQDGWYFTGDLGYRDEDGDLWLVGRVDDMIISGGENIYPITVEEALEEHELVKDIAVTGTEDERWGALVTAFIQLSTDDDDFDAIAAQLDEFCRENNELANYKRPRRYVFVEDIPKSAVGKKLRDQLPSLDEDERLAEVDL